MNLELQCDVDLLPGCKQECFDPGTAPRSSGHASHSFPLAILVALQYTGMACWNTRLMPSGGKKVTWQKHSGLLVATSCTAAQHIVSGRGIWPSRNCKQVMSLVMGLEHLVVRSPHGLKPLLNRFLLQFSPGTTGAGAATNCEWGFSST